MFAASDCDNDNDNDSTTTTTTMIIIAAEVVIVVDQLLYAVQFVYIPHLCTQNKNVTDACTHCNDESSCCQNLSSFLLQ